MEVKTPNNWQTVNLGTVANVNMGQSPSSKFYNTKREGLPFYQGVTDFGEKYPSTNMYCSEPTKIAEPGTALFSVRAPVGEVNIATDQSCIGRGVASISMKNGDNNFLYFLLKYKSKYLKNISGGTTYESINKDQIEEIEVDIPKDIVTQKKVASILSAFDDKIEVNNKIAKTLEEMAQEIFKEWFVNFHFPGHEKTEFVDSEFGKIPKTWAVGTLERLVDIRNGYAFKSGDYKTKGIPIIRTMDFDKNGSVVLGNQIYLSEETAEKYNNFLLNKFDFLLVMVGASLGKWAIVPSNILPGLQNQNMWNFRPKEVIFTFFNIQFLKKLVWKQRKSATGSARDFFRKDYFYSIKALIPDDKALVSFNKIVEPIYEKLDLILGENKKLSTLRDSLLPKLMKGEIKV